MQAIECAEIEQDISARIEALLQRLERPDYCEFTTQAEFQRDMAIALELGQRQIDLYSELIDEVFTDFDKKYFEAFSKRYDERHNQPKP